MKMRQKLTAENTKSTKKAFQNTYSSEQHTGFLLLGRNDAVPSREDHHWLVDRALSPYHVFVRPIQIIPLVLIAARTLGVAFSVFLLYATLYEDRLSDWYDFLNDLWRQLPCLVFLFLVMLPYRRMHHPWLWMICFVLMALLSSAGAVLVVYWLRRAPWDYVLYVGFPAIALFMQAGIVWAFRYSTPCRRYLANACDRTKKTERRLVVTLVSVCLLAAVFDAVYIAVEPVVTAKPTLLMRTEALGPGLRIDSSKDANLTRLFCQADYFLDDEIKRYHMPFLSHVSVSQDGNTLYYVFYEPSATDSYIIYRVKVGTFLPIEKWYDGGA